MPKFPPRDGQACARNLLDLVPPLRLFEEPLALSHLIQHGNANHRRPQPLALLEHHH